MSKKPKTKSSQKATEGSEPTLETRRLRDLRPHPKQAYFFPDLHDEKLQALADDISRNGLQNPIEILPQNQAGLPINTILRGHQRRRALELMGLKETEVKVCYHLATASDAEIEIYFIDDNDNRRHHDPLAMARIALARYEIEKKHPHGQRFCGPDKEQEARDRVGRAIGMSGRNLQRYFQVLRTPIAIQHAFQEKKLSLELAGWVSTRHLAIQYEMVERIRAGEDPKTVVSEYRLGKNKLKDHDTETAERLGRCLRDLIKMGGQSESLNRALPRKVEQALREGRRAIDKLISRSDAIGQEVAALLQTMFEAELGQK